MNLLAVSINHRTAPTEVRESLFLGEEEVKKFIREIKDNLLGEGLIISTCNRTEIYGLPLTPTTTHKDIQSTLLKYKPVPNINSNLFQTFSGRSAVNHLFDVASGIDSMLVGDNQIFKQVKESFQLADEMAFSGFLLRKIFDAALKTGKRAISETSISEGAVTVSFAAVQLIEKIFSSLNKKSALVIGAGETGEIAVKHLIEKGIGRLAITNRTIERAEKIAGRLHTKIIPFANFKDFLHEYDIIISATSAENIILTKNEIEAAMNKRNYTAMVLMDIAIPHDIDPASSEIDYVFYHNIDSLNIIIEKNLEKRKAEIPKVKNIIEEELTSFFNWYNSLEAAPAIKNLRDHFEAIRTEEVGKNKNKFSADDQEKLEIITKRIINKLLHQPTVELKKNSESGTRPEETAMKISILKELFGIGGNSSEKDK
jgi:glutamyl-tRNA reductase